MNLIKFSTRGNTPRYSTQKYCRTSPMRMFSVGSTLTNAANEPNYRKSFARNLAVIIAPLKKS